MSFQKNAFAGAAGLWTIVWCSAGFSLVVNPGAPGPLAYAAGLTRAAMGEFLRQNGLSFVDPVSALVVLGIACMSVGASFGFSLYAADRGRSRSLVLRSCCAASFLVLLIGGIGGSTNNWAILVDTLLLAGLGLAALVTAMDKHENMPMMPVEPDRFHAALVERMAQEKALELYLEACRTSSRTSRDFGSDRPIPSSTRQA